MERDAEIIREIDQRCQRCGVVMTLWAEAVALMRSPCAILISVSTMMASVVASPLASRPATTAIIGFRNLSGSAELKPLESGFADLLTAYLSAYPSAALVERKAIARILEEQTLSLSGLAESDDAPRVGLLVGARRLIMGDFTKAENEIRVTARLYDVESGRILAVEEAKGASDSLDQVLRQLAAGLAKAMQLKFEEPAGPEASHGAAVRTLEASVHFARGMSDRYRGNWQEAAEAFARVALLEPRSTAWIHRNECLRETNNVEAAIQAGRDCLARDDLLVPLTPVQRYEITIHCASLLWASGKRDEAIALAKMLENAPGWIGNHVRNWLYAAQRARAGRAWEPITEPIALDLRKSPGELHRSLNEVCGRCPIWDGARLQQIIDAAWEASGKQPDESWANWFAHTIVIRIRNHLNLGGGRFQPKKTGTITPDYVEGLVTALRLKWPQSETLCREGASLLAQAYGKQERWREAIDAYLELAACHQQRGKKPDEYLWRTVVEHWSETGFGVPSADREAAAALCEAALLCYSKANDFAQGLQIAGRLTDGYALQGRSSRHLIRHMAAQNHTPSFPERLGLVTSPNGVCGGNDPLCSAWRPVLERADLTVHGWAGSGLNDVLLPNYDLIVCVGTGPRLFSWDDVERLRGYVARGGRLLIVLGAPESAAPLFYCHRPLLRTFGFDVSATQRIEQTTARPTAAAPGFPDILAKGVIPFLAPDQTVLYRCDEGAVVALADYGAGRIGLIAESEWIRTDQLPGERLSLLDGIIRSLLAPPVEPGVRRAAGLFRRTNRLFAQGLFRTAVDVPEDWGYWYYDTRQHAPELLRAELVAAQETLDQVINGDFSPELKAESTLALADFYMDHTTDSDQALALYRAILKDHPRAPAAAMAWIRLVREKGKLEQGPSDTVPWKGSVFWAQAAYFSALKDWKSQRHESAEAICREVIEGLPPDDPQRFKPALVLYLILKESRREEEAERLRGALQRFPSYYYDISDIVSETDRYRSSGTAAELFREADRMVGDRMKR